METRNTPLDYSDRRIWVYFELGGAASLTIEEMIAICDGIDSRHIIQKNYGFNLSLCNQHIPEIVRVLTQKNIAIYQIVRI